MTPGQVSAFLHEAGSKSIHIDRIKLVGGEPFCSPFIVDIVKVLIQDGIEAGIVGSVKLDTNGIAPIPPDMPTHPFLRIGGRKPRKKVHLPFLWSPADLGLEWHGPCSHPYRCGFSLDAKGWQPCSPAVMIDRLFYGGSHYQDSIPTVPWGCDELCRYCIYAGPLDWRSSNAKPIRDFTREMKSPTRSWAEALRRAGIAVENVYEPK